MIKQEQINESFKVNKDKYTAIHGIVATDPIMDEVNNIPVIYEGVYQSLIIDKVKREEIAKISGSGKDVSLKQLITEDIDKVVIARIQTEDISVVTNWINFVNATFN